MGRSEEPPQIPPAELARKNRPTDDPRSRDRKYSNASVSAASAAADAPTTLDPAHHHTAAFPWGRAAFSNAAAARSIACRSLSESPHGKAADLNRSHPSRPPKAFSTWEPSNPPRPITHASVLTIAEGAPK